MKTIHYCLGNLLASWCRQNRTFRLIVNFQDIMENVQCPVEKSLKFLCHLKPKEVQFGFLSCWLYSIFIVFNSTSHQIPSDLVRQKHFYEKGAQFLFILSIVGLEGYVFEETVVLRLWVCGVPHYIIVTRTMGEMRTLTVDMVTSTCQPIKKQNSLNHTLLKASY